MERSLYSSPEGGCLYEVLVLFCIFGLAICIAMGKFATLHPQQTNPAQIQVRNIASCLRGLYAVVKIGVAPLLRHQSGCHGIATEGAGTTAVTP